MTTAPAPLQVFTVMLEEQFTVSGGHCGGLTVTVKKQLVLLPHASEALHMTEVVPIGKMLPLGGLQFGVTGPVQAFEAVLVKNTGTPPVQFDEVTIILDEQLSVSAQRVTVTLKLQKAVWPQASVAVQLTEVVPIGKMLPLGGLHEAPVGAQPPEGDALE